MIVRGSPMRQNYSQTFLETHILTTSSTLFPQTMPKPYKNIPTVLPNTSQHIPKIMKKWPRHDQKVIPKLLGIEPGTLGFWVRGPTHWVIRDPKKRARESNPVPLDSESGDQPTGSSELKNTALKGFLCFKKYPHSRRGFFRSQNRDSGAFLLSKVNMGDFATPSSPAQDTKRSTLVMKLCCKSS